MNQFVKVGESQVFIHAKGCVTCGTWIADTWHRARVVEVHVGATVRTLILCRCGSCQDHQEDIARDAIEGAEARSELGL